MDAACCTGAARVCRKLSVMMCFNLAEPHRQFNHFEQDMPCASPGNNKYTSLLHAYRYEPNLSFQDPIPTCSTSQFRLGQCSRCTFGIPKCMGMELLRNVRQRSDGAKRCAGRHAAWNAQAASQRHWALGGGWLLKSRCLMRIILGTRRRARCGVIDSFRSS